MTPAPAASSRSEGEAGGACLVPDPLGDVAGSGRMRVAPEVAKARIYTRYLHTSEAIANFRAGR